VPQTVFRLLAFITLAAHSLAAQENTADSDTVVIKAPTQTELFLKTLHFSRRTTRTVLHRTESGLPDYAAAINEHYGNGVTPENNGAVLLYQCLGPQPGETPLDKRFFQLMGMKKPPSSGNHFTSLFEGVPRERFDNLSDEQETALSGPWTVDECPHVAEWLDKHADSVAKAIAATYRPQYFSPLIVSQDSQAQSEALVSIALPGVQGSRSIARFLVCRAMRNLSAGDTAGAWKDLQACHRLGRMIARGPTLVEYLVGIAINSIATGGDLVFLNHLDTDSAEQLASYRTDLTALPPFPDIATHLDWYERMMFLDCVVLAATGQTASLRDLGLLNQTGEQNIPLDSVLARLTTISVDWNTVMKNGNQLYDQLVVAMKKSSHPERNAALARFDRLRNQKTNRISLPGFLKRVSQTGISSATLTEMASDVITGLLIFSGQSLNDAQTRDLQTQQNLVTAFALVEWKLRRGSYPPSLDQLVTGKLLKMVPLDHFSGNPVRYIRNGNDGFFIYSIGPNGTDEGGRWYEDDPAGDDPRIRFPAPAAASM